MGYIGIVNIDGTQHKVGSTLYGTCATEASTAAKVVTCSDFTELPTGVTIHVKFTYSNTAANPTLNINSKGAKSIYRYGTTVPGTTAETSWNAGAVVSFTYDGSSFIMNDWVNTNTNTDTNVTQTATNTNANYEILFSGTADNTTRTEGARKYSNLTFNPSTGTLTTTKAVASTSTLGVADIDTANITEDNVGNLIVTGAARFLNTINGSISGNAATASDSAKLNGYASDTAATNNTIARRTANGYIFATYFNQSSGAETPTSSSYMIYANSDGYFRKSTVANMKTAMSLNNVENKSSATIRGELTSSNVTTALGYTPVNKAGDTMTGALHVSNTGKLIFDWTANTDCAMFVLKDAERYGIRYQEGNTDKMKFSASGNANTDNADLCINGAGDGTVTIRGNTIIHAGNYTSYTVKKDGTGASGTWGISISGNAATATNVAWTGVTGKPSEFTPSSGSGYYLTREPWWNSSDTSKDPDTLLSGITFAYNNKHGNVPTTGTLVSFSARPNNDKYPLQLQGSYNSTKLYFRNRNGDNNTWNDWKEIIHAGNIGAQSVNYATSAGSATKATQDGNGNVISSAYLPLAGGTLTNADAVYFTATNTTKIDANSVSIIQSPIPKYLWHDLFGFNRYGTPTYYVTADGSTWAEATLDKSHFAELENIGENVIKAKGQCGARWVWGHSSFAYSCGAWLVIGVGYANPSATVTITFESSTDTSAWTLRHQSTHSGNSAPIWCKIDGYGSSKYLRLTITKDSSDTTRYLNIGSIRLLTARWGSQGGGVEFEYPYYWDADRTISTLHLRPTSNNAYDLGTTSLNWANVYATTFHGALDGNAATATTALNLSGFENNNSSGKNANSVTYNAHTYYTSNGPATSIGASTGDGALYTQAYSTAWVGQIAQDYRDGSLFVRGKNNGTWQKWLAMLDSGNIGYNMTSTVSYDPHNRRFITSKSTSAWDAQAYSQYGYADAVYVTFKPNQTNMAMMIGLDSNPSEDANYNKIDYALYCMNNGKVSVYESGSEKSVGAPVYVAGDEFKVEYVGGYVRYYHNGTLLREVARSISGKLYMDSSFHGATSCIYDVEFGCTTTNAKYAASANTANTATSATTATTARKIVNDTIRMTSPNTAYYDGGLRYYLASSSMTTDKPPLGDGKILDMQWDNNGGWATQLYITHSNTNTATATRAMLRSQNGTTWKSWIPVAVFNQTTPTTGQVVVTDGTDGGVKSSGYTIATSVPANAVFTDTNYYHTTGSWSGLTYTATANGGAGALAFTIPTGTSATTVAVGNHNHNGTYVKVAGDSMTGTLCMNSTNGNYGEGIRINAGNGGYSSFTIGTAANSTSGISDCGFWIGTNVTNTSYQRKLYIAHNASTASTTYFYASSASDQSPSLQVGGTIVGRGVVCANAANSSTAGGLSLYGTDPTTYGVIFRGTGNQGKHGYVQSDWATYFTMNSGATTRGWVFKLNQTNGTVASISGAGNAVLNGSLTIGGNAANTSGCRLVYSSLGSVDFVFV